MRERGNVRKRDIVCVCVCAEKDTMRERVGNVRKRESVCVRAFVEDSMRERGNVRKRERERVCVCVRRRVLRESERVFLCTRLLKCFGRRLAKEQTKI